MSLSGKTIALAEGRQIEELAALLEAEGASVVRCPLVSILDPADDQPVLNWIRTLIAGRFAYVILLTGEGLRRMLACAERHQLREAFIAALAKTPTVCRGPKPGRTLKEIGLNATIVAKAPTTDGVIESLRSEPLRGQTVGVQLYREDNPPLLHFLQEAGATPHAVLPYIYAPASDAERVTDLLERMDRGEIDVLVFTSSPQVDRLYEVAEERGLAELLSRALTRAKVAAVGPIVADNLRARGARVDICPEQGFVMKNLVQHIKRA